MALTLDKDDYSIVRTLTGRYGIGILAPVRDYYRQIVDDWDDLDMKRAASEIAEDLDAIIKGFDHDQT